MRDRGYLSRIHERTITEALGAWEGVSPVFSWHDLPILKPDRPHRKGSEQAKSVPTTYRSQVPSGAAWSPSLLGFLERSQHVIDGLPPNRNVGHPGRRWALVTPRDEPFD
jgi:hypothetical protein